jgi:hypothetical protein
MCKLGVQVDCGYANPLLKVNVGGSRFGENETLDQEPY